MGIIRNIVVRIGADITDLQRQLQGAQKSLESFGKQMSNIGKGLTSAITLPVVGLGVAAVKSAADFEESMSKIQAVTGLEKAGTEMEKLKNLALEMGAKTKYSAGEAAAGIEELIKAGVSVTDILGGGLEAALGLAAAGEIELADAAEIASTVLNAFRSDGLTVADAANVLAGAANASATDVMGLKMGLSQVSAVASGVGLSFKDTATALSVFAQNGLKGSDAGTSLKTMLMNLIPSTDKQIIQFKKLGLMTAEGGSAFFDAAGKVKSLSDIAGLLKTSLADLTDEQRLSALETMFGSDAIRAANVLYKEGADGVNNMATAMTQFTAAEVAAAKMDNFKGMLEQLKGSLETLGIQIGTLFLPKLTEIAKYLMDVTNNLMTLDPNLVMTIATIAGIAAAIGPVIMALGGFITALGTVAGALSFLISPVGLVIAALAGIGAAIVILWTQNEDFRNTILTIWGEITSFFMANSENIKTTLIAVWELIKTSLNAAWDFIKSTAITIFEALKLFWALHGEEIKAFLIATWTEISTRLQLAWDILKTIAITVFNEMQKFWEKHGEEVMQQLKSTWETTSKALEVTWKIISDVARTIFDALLKFWNEHGETVVKVLSNAWEMIWTIIKPIWDKIDNDARTIFGALQAFWNTWGDEILASLTNIWNTASDVIGGALKTIQGLFDIVLGAIQGDWGRVWNGMKEVVEGIFGAIKGIVKGILNAVIGSLNGFVSALNGLSFNTPDWVPGLGGKSFSFNVSHIPYLEDGTNYVPQDMVAYLHKGEAVVPKKYNEQSEPFEILLTVPVVLDGKEIARVTAPYQYDMQKSRSRGLGVT